MKTFLLSLGLLSLLSLSIMAMPSETCFKSGEQKSGMNKICFYKCPSGGAAMTVGAAEFCPLTMEK